MIIASRYHIIAAALLAALAFTITTIARAADPLPSWNDGPAKKSIITFVERVTREGSPDFVAAPLDGRLGETRVHGACAISRMPNYANSNRPLKRRGHACPRGSACPLGVLRLSEIAPVCGEAIYWVAFSRGMWTCLREI